MLAARWHGPGDIRVEEIEPPKPEPGQVIIEVERCGICGIDLLEYLTGPINIPVGEPHPASGRKAPMVLGHEVVGTVVECPDNTVTIGTRVVPDVVIGCGTCWACLRHEEMNCPSLVWRGMHTDGGLAQFMVAEASTLIPVPDGLDPDRAAFTEPLGVAIRALRKSGDVTGAIVCVIGAGVFGALSCQVAVDLGAAAVIAVDQSTVHRQAAERLGATVAVEPAAGAAALLDASGGRGADIVVETTGGSSRIAEAIRLSRRGGTITLLGLRNADIPLPILDMVVGERRLIGIAGHIWDQELTAAMLLLATGRLDPSSLISARIPLTRVVEHGFHRLATDRDTLEVLVDPTGV
jgi:(R,R)-butanediol dehydrogenase / meso-butanediol dehydrogenase / diacetyl reductase